MNKSRKKRQRGGALSNNDIEAIKTAVGVTAGAAGLAGLGYVAYKYPDLLAAALTGYEIAGVKGAIAAVGIYKASKSIGDVYTWAANKSAQTVESIAQNVKETFDQIVRGAVVERPNINYLDPEFAGIFDDIKNSNENIFKIPEPEIDPAVPVINPEKPSGGWEEAIGGEFWEGFKGPPIGDDAEAIARITYGPHLGYGRKPRKPQNHRPNPQKSKKHTFTLIGISGKGLIPPMFR